MTAAGRPEGSGRLQYGGREMADDCVTGLRGSGRRRGRREVLDGCSMMAGR